MTKTGVSPRQFAFQFCSFVCICVSKYVVFMLVLSSLLLYLHVRL